MATNPISLDLVQGDSFLKTITIAVEGSPSAVDLTDATISGSIRKEYTTDVLLTFTVSNRDDANGQFDISLTPAQTASLPMNRDGRITSFVFDVQVAYNTGVVRTYLYGYLKVQREVTL